MGGTGSRLALALILVAAGLAGCVAYSPVSGSSCEPVNGWSDQLLHEEAGLHGSLDVSSRTLNGTGNGTWQAAGGAVAGPDLAHVTVTGGDEVVRARATVDPSVNGSLVVDHPRLEATGGTWLETLTWYPEGDETPQLAYMAPEGGEGGHVLHLRFLPDVTSSSTREAMASVFADALFPEAETADWEEALEARRPVAVDAAVDAEGVVGSALDGNATVRAASLGYGDALPGTRGQVVVEATGVGNLSGRLVATLVHEVKAVSAPGAEVPVTLEVTPADAATVTAFADEPLGAEALTDLAADHLEPAPGVPDLGLDEARYQAADRPADCR